MATRAFPCWLVELLGVVRARPGMFLGSEELNVLMTFVSGFEAARIWGGATHGPSPFAEFGRWVCEKYSHSGPGGFVPALEVAFQSRPDLWPSKHRRDASPTDGVLRLFFEDLDAFLALRGESLPPTPELAVKFFPRVDDEDAGIS